MNNVESIFKNQQRETFTKEVPEDATLTMLCMNHKVKCFEIEIDGNVMVLAHFEKDGALSNHLFFWITAYQGETTPEDVVLDFFPSAVLNG